MNNPLISIIIPTHNSKEYINECLNSILNQTYKKIEIIIIDNGSTDNTLETIQNFKNKDNRIKRYSQNKKGVGYARNEGLKHAKRRIYMFC